MTYAKRLPHHPDEEDYTMAAKKRKDPAAVALGRKGGRVKGKARWAKTDPKELSRIMRALARRRWSHKRGRA